MAHLRDGAPIALVHPPAGTSRISVGVLLALGVREAVIPQGILIEITVRCIHLAHPKCPIHWVICPLISASMPGSHCLLSHSQWNMHSPSGRLHS